MKSKVQEKEMAIKLRKSGYSYRDILKKVPVSKSTLSLWLKDLPLTNDEKNVLKKRKDVNIAKGRIKASLENKRRKEVRIKEDYQRARQMFEENKNDWYFCTGIALYWAEGGKRTNSFQFMNSDPEMIRFIIDWIYKYLPNHKEKVNLRLYTHKAYNGFKYEDFWSKITSISKTRFKKTIIKKSNSLHKKRPNYKGCLRVEIQDVRVLRMMKAWQNYLISQSKKI